MKRYTLIEILVVLAILMILGGSLVGVFGGLKQWSAKEFGGSTTVILPVDKKLINVTWKESEIWYLVRDMHEAEAAETYEFKEVSKLGLLQGTVILKESKSLTPEKK